MRKRRRRRRDPLRDARAEMYRGLVRDAAERVFAGHGFARARITHIARESRVSIGTIYRVFPGRKDEIYRAIQEHRGTVLIGRSHAIGLETWRQRSDLLDATAAGVTAMVEFFAEHPDYLRLVLREEKAWAAGAKRSSKVQSAMWREGSEGIVAMMRLGVGERIFVDDDPEIMARTWMAIQEAHLGHWLEGGMRATPAEVARRLQRQFLRAFCRPEVLVARGVVDAPASATTVEGTGAM
jgi:AcrR family transcriptional regulator